MAFVTRHGRFRVRTESREDVIDIAARVRAALERSAVRSGTCLVATEQTTTAVY